MEKLGDWDEGQMITIYEFTWIILNIEKWHSTSSTEGVTKGEHELWELQKANGADVYTRVRKEREVRAIRW